MKILPAEMADDAERMKRFTREAKLLASLNHPNILTIHDFSIDAGTSFIVTEWLEGETLHQSICTGRRGLLQPLLSSLGL